MLPFSSIYLKAGSLPTLGRLLTLVHPSKDSTKAPTHCGGWECCTIVSKSLTTTKFCHAQLAVAMSSAFSEQGVATVRPPNTLIHCMCCLPVAGSLQLVLERVLTKAAQGTEDSQEYASVLHLLHHACHLRVRLNCTVLLRISSAGHA